MDKGFTFVEVMIAAFVTLIGVVGVYALVPRLVATTVTNIQRFTASQLAREGIEIVRNIRDSNGLQNLAWDANGIDNCDITSCEADYNDSSLSPWAATRFNIDANGYYTYAPGIRSTSFRREIIITPQIPTVSYLVRVEVSWTGKYSPFTVEEELYNWR